VTPNPTPLLTHRYPPHQRPSAAEALAHPYFSSPPVAATPSEVAAFAAAALRRHERVEAMLLALGGGGGGGQGQGQQWGQQQLAAAVGSQ